MMKLDRNGNRIKKGDWVRCSISNPVKYMYGIIGRVSSTSSNATIDQPQFHDTVLIQYNNTHLRFYTDNIEKISNEEAMLWMLEN
jgi:hypothetical protein